MSAAVAGLVVALPEECRSLTRRRIQPGEFLRLGDTRLLGVAGVGSANATAAARRLIEAGARGLVSWGCAAGLVPTLRPGVVCLPREILDPHGSRWAVSEAWHQRATGALQTVSAVRTDSLLTVDRVAATAADKRSLAAAFGAIAVDMESAAVAAVAREHGVPFLAVRAIADPEDFALPAAVLQATDARGIVRRSVLLGHLLLHPSELSSLLRLASHFRAALGALRHAADAFGPDMLLGEALDKRFRT